MTGFEVYKMYLALKNHFTTDTYDYGSIRGKVNANEKHLKKDKTVISLKN